MRVLRQLGEVCFPDCGVIERLAALRILRNMLKVRVFGSHSVLLKTSFDHFLLHYQDIVGQELCNLRL